MVLHNFARKSMVFAQLCEKINGFAQLRKEINVFASLILVCSQDTMFLWQKHNICLLHAM